MIIDLNKLAEGAALEAVNREMQRVMENIADPNTDPNSREFNEDDYRKFFRVCAEEWG